MNSKFPYISAAILLIIVSFLYGKHNGETKYIKEYSQITQELAKSKIEVLSKTDTINKINQLWESEKKYLEDKITQLSKTDFQLKNSSVISSSVDLSRSKYIFHEIHFSDNGTLGPPIGYVMVYGDGHVVSKIYQHHITVEQVQSTDGDGNYSVLNKAFFVLEQSGLANRKDSKKQNWVNKPYPLNVLNSEVSLTQLDKIKKFKIFDPKLGLSANISNFGPSLGGSVSISSYSNFRFFRFGIDKDINNKNYNLFFAPIEHNLTNVFNNTYLYPFINLNNNADFGAGLGISVNF